MNANDPTTPAMVSLGAFGSAGAGLHLTDKRDRVEVVVGPGNYAVLNERAVLALVRTLESWLSSLPGRNLV